MAATEQEPAIGRGASMRMVLSVAAVTLIAVAGYAGFRAAAGLDLGAETGAGVVALAALTGFAVFFSPCSFPLMVVLLAGSDRAAAARQRRRDSLETAVAIGAGASLFLLLVGLVVGLIGQGVAKSVGFATPAGRSLRAAVSLTIVAAGLTQLGVFRVPLWRVTRLAQPLERRRANLSQNHEHAAHVLYGFAFILAGFG